MGTKIVTISSLNSSFRNNQLINETIVSLNGWVRTNRNNGTLGFIEFNDGTTLKNLQIVYDKNTSNFEVATKVRTGAAIYVEGKIILTPNTSNIVVYYSVDGGTENTLNLTTSQHTEFMFTKSFKFKKGNTNVQVYYLVYLDL